MKKAAAMLVLCWGVSPGVLGRGRQTYDTDSGGGTSCCSAAAPQGKRPPQAKTQPDWAYNAAKR
jgi:hypothetical protein